MAKFYSSDHILKTLRKNGFHFVSQKGSHIKYRRELEGKALTVIIPADRKEIPIGTFHSILKQSNLTRSDF